MRVSFNTLALAALGGGLAYRSVTGRGPDWRELGARVAEPAGKLALRLPGKRRVTVRHSVAINAPPDALFRYWRDFTNLPRFMDHLVSVEPRDGNRSHWVDKAPGGGTVEWDAEIIKEEPDALISWRSLPGADVDNSGTVRFTALPAGRGTEVRVTLEYDAPGGQIGAALARLTGEEPQQQITEDLRHFKQIMEAGEVPSTKGQPSGPRDAESRAAAQPGISNGVAADAPSSSAAEGASGQASNGSPAAGAQPGTTPPTATEEARR